MTIATVAGATLAKRTVDREQAIIWFVTLQFFVLIYLQRFALAPNSFPLSIPMVAMLGGIGWMVFTQQLSFDPKRLATYLLFAGACLLSQSFSGGSFPSLMQLIVLYAAMTVSIKVSHEAYLKILDRFIKLMIVPCICMIIQFTYQKATGEPTPLSMNRLVPQSMMLQGYFYEAHYPWYSNYSRPNGFFMLEPSYASAFSATALIMEITYFRRLRMVLFLTVATLMTQGSTGISMLLIAGPFLLIREKWAVIISTVTAIVAALVIAIAVDAPLPLVSRVGEFKSESSSGSERLLMPAERFLELAFDPAYFIIGDGGGSVIQKVETQKNGAPKTGTAVMNPWPMVKVLNEYGLIAMISYLTLYGMGIAGRFNVPLKIALSVVFLFTGGYLVSPPVMTLMVMLFFLVSPQTQPARAQRGDH